MIWDDREPKDREEEIMVQDIRPPPKPITHWRVSRNEEGECCLDLRQSHMPNEVHMKVHLDRDVAQQLIHDILFIGSWKMNATTMELMETKDDD